MKRQTIKPVDYPKQWATIYESTYEQIKGHHRNNQFDMLLGLWSSKWPTRDLTGLMGTSTLLLANKTGRVSIYSNYRDVCPRFRLMDYDARLALECHIRKHTDGAYIGTIYLVELIDGLAVTTCIFEYVRDTDDLVTFNATRMSELNQQLGN